MSKIDKMKDTGLMILSQAELAATRDLLMSLAKSLGVHKIDDLSLKDYFESKRSVHVEEYLASLDKSDPQMAEMIRKAFAHSKTYKN